MTRAPAAAKINLALVVGPARNDGRHEVTTVLQAVDLTDRITVSPGPGLRVTGFPEDTLVRGALAALAERAGVEPAWHVRIRKRIPVAAGLGGGSSDAALALRLANATLDDPLDRDHLFELAAELGSDVPFFLASGPQLGEGHGAELTPLELPQDFWIVLIVPEGERKPSTGAVYTLFDARDGARGYAERREALLEALENVREARDLAALPHNDLASSPLAAELLASGAFRADVTGAGPAVYGLFHDRADAARARRTLRRHGRIWLVVPAWYV